MVEFLLGLSVLDFLQTSFRIHLLWLQTQYMTHPLMVHHSVLLFLQGLHDTLEFLENSWIFENFYQALEHYLKISFWH